MSEQAPEDESDEEADDGAVDARAARLAASAQAGVRGLRLVEGLGLLHVHEIVRPVSGDCRAGSTSRGRSIVNGAEKWLELHRHEAPGDCVRDLHALGFTVLAAVPPGAAVLGGRAPILLEEVDFGATTALVFGNEARGVSEELLTACDGAFTVPLVGLTESLNVSVAAAVCCHFGRHCRAKALGLAPGQGDFSASEVEALRTSYLQRGGQSGFTASVRCSRSRKLQLEAGLSPVACGDCRADADEAAILPKEEHLIIVTELLRDNLYEFSKFNRESGDEPFFTLGRIQKITKQVLSALEYVHSLRLIHCDLKPENILLKSYSQCEVKVIDFGSSCFIDDHLSSYVQSRSYRAPEVMLGLPYDQKIDLWSLGCIVAELWTGYVLFQNDSVQSLLARILGIIGPFPCQLMMRGRHVPQYFTQDGQLYQEIDGPSCPERGRRLHLLVPKKTSLRQRMRTDCEEFLDFLEQLLRLDPSKRPTATEALQHPFIKRCKFPDGL